MVIEFNGLIGRLMGRTKEAAKTTWQQYTEMVDALLAGKKFPEDQILVILDAAGQTPKSMESRLKMLSRLKEVTEQRERLSAEAAKLPGLEAERARVNAEWEASTRQFKERLEQIGMDVLIALGKNNQLSFINSERDDLLVKLADDGQPKPPVNPWPNARTEHDVLVEQRERQERLRAERREKQTA